MTKSNDEIQKEMKELRSDFCIYSFLIILTIAGFGNEPCQVVTFNNDN